MSYKKYYDGMPITASKSERQNKAAHAKKTLCFLITMVILFCVWEQGRKGLLYLVFPEGKQSVMVLWEGVVNSLQETILSGKHIDCIKGK